MQTGISSSLRLIALILTLAGCTSNSIIEKKEPIQPQAPSSKVYRSISEGNIAEVRKALQNGLPADAANDQGVSLLMTASLRGQLEIVKLLIDQGANIKRVDEDQQSCAHYSVGSRNEELIQYLISAGADYSKKDRFGFSPLLEWAYNQNWDLVRLQLKQDTTLKGLDEISDELLKILAEAKREELIRLTQTKLKRIP